jgi:hypothetical protein
LKRPDDGACSELIKGFGPFTNPLVEEHKMPKYKFVNDLAVGDKIEFSGKRVMTVTHKADRDQHHVSLSLTNETTGTKSDTWFNRMDTVVLHEHPLP